TGFGFSAAGTNGQCLVSSGTGAPVFSQCANGPVAGVNYWQLLNGTLSTINNTADLFVGGTSTNSAKFAVVNVNSGTPTASVSAGVGGAAFLMANGTLQSTARQTITIGGGNSGDVAINPLTLATINGNAIITGTTQFSALSTGI